MTGVAQIQRYFPELLIRGDGSQKLWLSHIAGLAPVNSANCSALTETERMSAKFWAFGLREAGSGKQLPAS